MALKSLLPEEFDSMFDYQKERIAIIGEIEDEDVLDQIDVEDLAKYVRATDWSYGNPERCHKEEIEGYIFKGFRRLTLGEFIDLEAQLQKGYYINLPKIAAILYRKYKVGEWGEMIFEPYGAVDLNKRAEEFSEWDVQDVFGMIREYLKFRNEFLERRKALFEQLKEEGGPDDEEDEEETEDEPLSPEEMAEEKSETMLKKWSWELFIYNLCKGDLTKADAVTDLNLFFVFNMAAMKKELKIEE